MRQTLCLLTIALPPALSACGSGVVLPANPWSVTQIGDTVIPPDRRPSLRFNTQQRVSGSTGCNQFTGRYAVSRDTLTVSELATTRKLCPPDLMAQEARFTAAFDRALSIRKSAGQSIELRVDGDTALLLSPSR